LGRLLPFFSFIVISEQLTGVPLPQAPSFQDFAKIKQAAREQKMLSF
jgi:hypothetical protein